MAAPQTEVGVVLGTPAYMAPEQATGQVVDRRADIWAFGCVFYEMLAGAPPHQRDTSQETIASILRDDPDLNKVPAQSHRLLKRCLEKDPQKRPRHIGDVMSLLDDPPSGQSSSSIASPVARVSDVSATARKSVAVARHRGCCRARRRRRPCRMGTVAGWHRVATVRPLRGRPIRCDAVRLRRRHGRVARRTLAGISGQRRGRRGPLLAAVARHGRSARAPGDRRRVRAGGVDVRQPVRGIHASRRAPPAARR